MSVDGAHEPSGRLRPRKPITYDESRHDGSSSRSETSSHPPGPSDSASAYAPSETVEIAAWTRAQGHRSSAYTVELAVLVPIRLHFYGCNTAIESCAVSTSNGGSVN